VPGKLFIVGDPKQSIYRFRRADVQVYHDVCQQLLRHGARHLTLTTSFRSTPNLQRCVNAGFDAAMVEDADTLQAGYIPLSPSRTPIGTQPSVVALAVPRPYGRRNISAMAIEQSLPDAVGAFIDWLVHESGWMVTTRTRLHPVPALRQLRHRCHAGLRQRAGGPRRTSPAGRRAGIPRP
jgi:hypothetical protein